MEENRIVTLGFIYCLKNPNTKEIFYIGASESAPKDRLKSHYSHFREYLRGIRKSNKRFKYFEKIWPNVAEIELIDIIQNESLYDREIEYIKQYSETCELTNQTIGGNGGDTFSLQDSIDKEKISKLIAEKNSKPKPKGFAENLSKTRMGSNNPMAKKSTMPAAVILDKDNKFIKFVKYPYEITEFFDSIFGIELHKKNSAAVGNISKGLKAKGYMNSKGFLFKVISDCSKEIQDIVHENYESNF